MSNPRMLVSARKSALKPTAPPRQGLVDAILACSLSQEFEQARREWSFEGDIVVREDEGFQEHCPCGAALANMNFILVNQKTAKKLAIGSDCIRRFVILTGTETAEDSTALFERMINAIKRNEELVKTLPEILKPKVKASDLFHFRRLAQSFLGGHDPLDFNEIKWREFLNLLGLGECDRVELKRIRDVLFKPSAVPREDNVIELKPVSEEKLREELTWRKRSKARVTTTLSDSEIYHTERYVERKDKR